MAIRKLKDPMVLPHPDGGGNQPHCLASFIVSEACGCCVIVGRRADNLEVMTVTASCGPDHEDLGEEVHEAIEASTWVPENTELQDTLDRLQRGIFADAGFPAGENAAAGASILLPIPGIENMDPPIEFVTILAQIVGAKGKTDPSGQDTAEAVIRYHAIEPRSRGDRRS